MKQQGQMLTATRNYYEVLRAMNDAPVEANGLYWFGVGIGQGAQLLQQITGSSGAWTTSAQAYLVKQYRQDYGYDLGRAALAFKLFMVYSPEDEMGGCWAALTFFPDDSYEAAMTLIGEAVKALVNA